MFPRLQPLRTRAHQVAWPLQCIMARQRTLAAAALNIFYGSSLQSTLLLLLSREYDCLMATGKTSACICCRWRSLDLKSTTPSICSTRQTVSSSGRCMAGAIYSGLSRGASGRLCPDSLNGTMCTIWPDLGIPCHPLDELDLRRNRSLRQMHT